MNADRFLGHNESVFFTSPPGNEQSRHVAFARPIIDRAIAIEGLIASSVLMLCARARGVQDGGERCLYAFATAKELIVLSLGGHAQLSNDL
jgi:hypothetical protein